MKIESKKKNIIIKLGSVETSLSFIEKNHEFVDLDPYYINAINFIREWRSGKPEFLITTSGSTGAPKAIRITRKQMISSARATAKALDLSDSYHSLVCLNINYIGGMMMIVRGLEMGMNMTIIKPNANPLANFRGTERFDFMAVVPLQLENMMGSLHEGRHIIDEIKCIIVGGAQVSSSLISTISKVSVPVFATYGMTETVSHIALQRLNGDKKENFFITLENIALKLDERECLAIRSPVTNDEWIQTNDIVELIDERRFKYVGRYDNVINSGGVKVHAERVEEVVGKAFIDLCISSRFFIYGVEDKKLGQRVCLFVEGESFDVITEKRVRTKIKDALPLYHAPKVVVYVSSFLETPTGKIDKRKIATEFL